jgi:hypothetical protein
MHTIFVHPDTKEKPSGYVEMIALLVRQNTRKKPFRIV